MHNVVYTCGMQIFSCVYLRAITLQRLFRARRHIGLGKCITLCAAALAAGMGLIDGDPSMSKEMILLGIGACVFTFGWWLERSK